MRSKPATPKLKEKSSAPNLKPRNVSNSSLGNTKAKSRQLPNKTSVPNLKNKSSVPSLKKRSISTSLPEGKRPYKFPLVSPRTPESQRSRFGPKQDGQTPKLCGPRFMSVEHAKVIKPVDYQPRPKFDGPKIPTIMGCTPSILRAKQVQAKESRHKRVLKAIKRKHEMKKVKWKGAVNRFMKKRMLRRLNGCVNGCLRAIRMNAQDKTIKAEYKPIYRLKEIRRVSALLALPKRQRPLSVATIGSIILGDARRYSELSVYSERVPDSAEILTLPAGAGCKQEAQGSTSDYAGVNGEEEFSVRASLLPFRDWLPILQSNTNPFAEDSDEEPTHTDSPETPRPNPNWNSPSFSSSSPNTPQSYSYFPSTDRNSSEIPSPASSEIIVIPWDAPRRLKMSPTTESSPQDPFVDSSTVENQVAKDKTDKTQHLTHTDKMEKTTEDVKLTLKSPQGNASTVKISQSEASNEQSKAYMPQMPKDQKTPMSQTLIRGREDGRNTRIPRGPTAKQAQGIVASSQKGLRVTPEHRSSIPIAVRKVSVEQSDTPENTPNSGFAGGIRVVDKPREPRPQPSLELQGGSIPESIHETAKEPEDCSSSSSVGSWDLGEQEMPELERPVMVFTGEYRTRPERRHYGPTLKIAASAENIIMGAEDNRIKDAMVTQRSPASSVRYVVGKPMPSSATEPRTQAKHSTATQGEGNSDLKKNDSKAPESTPVTRNLCRSQPSLESIPKRDFSGRELSIPRKPISRPSVANLFNAISEDLQPESVPLVPKIPDEHDPARKEEKPLPELKITVPVTPIMIKSQGEERLCDSVAVEDSVPETVGSAATARLLPPRTSSLKAVSDIPLQAESDADPVTPNEPALKRKVTFDDIISQDSSKDQPGQNGVRLPDSRSNRMLDSFRNIFKHKSGAEKARGKKDDSTEQIVARKNQIASDTKSTKITEDTKVDPGKSAAKAKAKYTRLSDGVTWNKSSRNLKASEEPSPSPMVVPTPTSSLSSIPALPSRNYPDDHTPSFARPTKSTRTKAASASRAQTPVVLDGRTRRTNLVAASTGSPHRSIRVQKRSIATPVPSALKSPNSSRPAGSDRPGHAPVQVKDSQNGDKPSDLECKSANDIQNFIATICEKVRDETTASKRENLLRLALSLQQQLGNYKAAEKEAGEAEASFYKKNLDKSLAENSLFGLYSQIQAQIDEE